MTSAQNGDQGSVRHPSPGQPPLSWPRTFQPEGGAGRTLAWEQGWHQGQPQSRPPAAGVPGPLHRISDPRSWQILEVMTEQPPAPAHPGARGSLGPVPSSLGGSSVLILFPGLLTLSVWPPSLSPSTSPQQCPPLPQLWPALTPSCLTVASLSPGLHAAPSRLQGRGLAFPAIPA